MTYSRASPSEPGGRALCQPTAEPHLPYMVAFPEGFLLPTGRQIPWLKRKRLKTRACFSLLAVQPTQLQTPSPRPVPQEFFTSRKAKCLASPYRDRDPGLCGHTGLNQGVYRMLSCHKRRMLNSHRKCFTNVFEGFVRKNITFNVKWAGTTLPLS